MDIRSPSLHDHGHTWVTDYLITAHSTWKAESGLGVFVGSNELSIFLLFDRDTIQLSYQRRFGIDHQQQFIKCNGPVDDTLYVG